MALRLELLSPSKNASCPYPRSGHRVVADDSNLYVLGGYNPDLAPEDAEPEVLQSRILIQMWKFNFFTRCWKEIPMTGDCPIALASHSASIHGNTLFTFGGSGIPFGIISSDSVCVSRVDSSVESINWKKLETTGDVPEKKYGQCQVMEWPFFYVIGGTTGYIYNMDVHCLNLQTCQWECLYEGPENPTQSDPEGRYRHEMVLHNNKLFSLGGGQSFDAFTLEKVPCFDLSTNQWTELRTTPDPYLAPQRQQGDHAVTGYPGDRKCHSCVLYKKCAYVFGGRSRTDAYGDLWRLNLDTLQWSCIIGHHVSPFTTFFHSAALTQSGCMYIFGGVLGVDDEKRSNSVYRTWLDVPSLQEMVWSKISDQLLDCQLPNLPERLMDCGVPAAFVKRLQF